MGSKRAIRIGNASGAIGDGLDQVYRLARDGNVDAITADYLAEFNLAWKAIEVNHHSSDFQRRPRSTNIIVDDRSTGPWL